MHGALVLAHARRILPFLADRRDSQGQNQAHADCWRQEIVLRTAHRGTPRAVLIKY
jgi:hypothetical protein